VSLAWAIEPGMVTASKEYPLQVYAYKENGIHKVSFQSQMPGMTLHIEGGNPEGDSEYIIKDPWLVEDEGKSYGAFSLWWNNESSDPTPSQLVLDLEGHVQSLKEKNLMIQKMDQEGEVKKPLEKITHWIFYFQIENGDTSTGWINVNVDSLTDQHQLIYDSNKSLGIITERPKRRSFLGS
jgi:hypothetical protein